MDKRELIQQEIDNLTGSIYGKNTDSSLIRIMKLQKRVNQYTLDGELINTFNSANECAKKNKLNVAGIGKSIQNKRPFMGFVFSYEGQPFNIKDVRKTGMKVAVSLLSNTGEVLINAYSYRDITNYLGLDLTPQESSKINHAISGRTKTYRKQYIIKSLD